MLNLKTASASQLPKGCVCNISGKGKIIKLYHSGNIDWNANLNQNTPSASRLSKWHICNFQEKLIVLT